VAAVLAATVAIGVAISLVLGNTPEDRAVALVPADAAFYATVYLDPSLGQQQAAKKVLERAGEAGAGSGDRDVLDKAIGAIVEGLTPADYERDVKPYEGNQLAVFARPSEPPTLLVATDAPRESLEAMHGVLAEEYPGDYYRIETDRERGHPYEHVVYSEDGEPAYGANAFAVVDGFVAIGHEEGVRGALDAASGRSLAGVDRLAEARDKVSSDVLAFAYIDPERLLDASRDDYYQSAGETAALEALADLGPVATTLTAGDGGAQLDLAMSSPPGAAPLSDPAALLETLPARASAAISIGDLGPLLRHASGGMAALVDRLRQGIGNLADLDLDTEISPWLGEVGAYLIGDDPETVEGAAVAQTHSRQASDAVLDRIESYYSYDYGFGDEYVYESGDGLGFDVGESENPLQVRGDSDRVIAGGGAAGFSTATALDANGGFGDSDLYRRAAGLLSGYEPFMAIDAHSMQRLFERAEEAEYDESYMREVRPWISSIETVAGGVRDDGGQLRIRLAASLDDGSG
jgi:hypothetical protein